MNARPDPLEPPAPRWPTWLAMTLLALITYLPAALGAELLQFDDNFFFGPDNPEFARGLGAVWAGPIANAYLPVAHTSLWLDFALAGDAPLLPHVHALLLHVIAAVLLVRLLTTLGVARLTAHVAAGLFVVHPALAESVAWVSSRKVVLSAVFVFWALLLTARFGRSTRAAGALGVARARPDPDRIAEATAVIELGDPDEVGVSRTRMLLEDVDVLPTSLNPASVRPAVRQHHGSLSTPAGEMDEGGVDAGHQGVGTEVLGGVDKAAQCVGGKIES